MPYYRNSLSKKSPDLLLYYTELNPLLKLFSIELQELSS